MWFSKKVKYLAEHKQQSKGYLNYGDKTITAKNNEVKKYYHVKYGVSSDILQLQCTDLTKMSVSLL